MHEESQVCLCFTTKVVKITTPHQADFLSACQLEFGDFVIKEQRATNVLIQILNVDSLKVNTLVHSRTLEIGSLETWEEERDDIDIMIFKF